MYEKMEIIEGPFCKRGTKEEKRKSGDKGPPFKSTWPLFELLLFLEDTVRHRQ